MGGAFITSRDIFENPIWQNIVEFRMFFLICGKAMFVEGVRIGDVTLKRGQWIRSYRNLQSDLEYIENNCVKRYSLSTIRNAITKLAQHGRVVVEGCRLGTLFTVLNYALYQGLDNYRTETENTQSDNERTGSEQGANNNKNVKNANTIYSLNPGEIDGVFETIWAAYPRKEGKAAIKPSQRKRLVAIGTDRMLAAIANYKHKVIGADPKFIMMGSTFFGGRYEDFLPETTSVPAPFILTAAEAPYAE